MTVEQLNIKITADSSEFRNEITAANDTMDKFRNAAKLAGNEVTSAFNGLINTQVTSENSATDSNGIVKADFPTAFWRKNPVSVTSEYYGADSAQAEVPEINNSETLIGRIESAGYQNDSQPINIRTTVELDGDAVGESVNRFNMRRNRITNGSEDK